MVHDCDIGTGKELDAEVLLQKLVVFRKGLQIETDAVVRRRVAILTAQAEADLMRLEAEPAVPVARDVH